MQRANTPYSKRSVFLLIFPLALGLLTGCEAHHSLARPRFEERARLIKTVVLMPPDVKIYQVTVGGSVELVGELSEEARKNLAAAVKGVLEEKGIGIRELSPGDDPKLKPKLKEEYEDVRSLFAAVSTAIGSVPPEISKHFRYSLGPLPELAPTAEADALLFVYGVDQVATGGRTAFRVLTALALIHPLLVMPAMLPGEKGNLMAALVDAQTGDLLWFSRLSQPLYLEELWRAASVAVQLFSSFEISKTAGPGDKP